MQKRAGPTNQMNMKRSSMNERSKRCFKKSHAFFYFWAKMTASTKSKLRIHFWKSFSILIGWICKYSFQLFEGRIDANSSWAYSSNQQATTFFEKNIGLNFWKNSFFASFWSQVNRVIFEVFQLFFWKFFSMKIQGICDWVCWILDDLIDAKTSWAYKSNEYETFFHEWKIQAVFQRESRFFEVLSQNDSINKIQVEISFLKILLNSDRMDL